MKECKCICHNPNVFSEKQCECCVGSMEIYKQVCSLELAQKMKELGFKQQSIFWWSRENLAHTFKLSSFARNIEKPEDGFKISAYSVAELGEMLPEDYLVWKNGKDDWFYAKRTDRRTNENDEEEELWEIQSIGQELTQADAGAQLLIYLKENIWIK